MATIEVELPQDLQEFVDTKLKQGHFTSASEYIVALVESARRGRSAIEAALIEGLNSGPAEEWTKEEWAGIRQRVIERHRGR
jgi:putative addiction module CopG family antidote